MSTAQEQAPSDTRTESPTLVRYLMGFGGLFVLTLGVASVVAAHFDRGILGPAWGYLLAAVGTAMLLFHALWDRDLEVRRAYGVFGGVLLLLAVGVGVFPAAPEGGGEAVAGQLLLPWGALVGVVALLFLVAYARHETEEPLRSWAHFALLGTGGLLVAAAVVVGVFTPDLMAGPGAVFGVLGLLYLGGYFTVADQSDGVPHLVAVGLIAVGGAAVAYALFRSVAPEVLFRGPAALRKADNTYEPWSVVGRGIVILVALSGLLALWAKRLPVLARVGIAAVGVGFAAVFLIAAFTNPVLERPAPYLVPGGLLLAAVGAAAAAMGVAVSSDAAVVVLTRRELAAFFYSPIGYVVLLGNAAVAGVLYLMLITQLFGGDPELGRGPVPEPIVGRFWALGIGAALSTPVLVAAITMRAFSEEKRSGTLEVLLTAPVNEWAVVLSKFTAALAFFLLCWLPSAALLLALRYAGGVPFDYHPLLSYYLAMFACGCGFVGFGVFVSSLTRNQIVAAVVTFAGLFAMFLTNARVEFSAVLGPGVRAALGRLDYFALWQNALEGQLPVSEVCVHLSLGVFWVFLTVKVLEARRWA